MRSWFQRQTGSETAALDLTAETFAQAWRGLRRFKDMADGSGAPWLFGIARNLLRQYHKHNRIETAARARLGMPSTGRAPRSTTPSTSASPPRAAAGAADAVGALPADQRARAGAAGRQQLPYEEVAGRLDCSINAARLRVSRALRALTAELGGRRVMRRPLPPELVALGDQLEAAAAPRRRRRRARRQRSSTPPRA